MKKEPTQYYKVVKIGRKYGFSGRVEVIATNCTLEGAKEIVNRYKSRPNSMMCFTKQRNFSQSKKSVI